MKTKQDEQKAKLLEDAYQLCVEYYKLQKESYVSEGTSKYRHRMLFVAVVAYSATIGELLPKEINLFLHFEFTAKNYFSIITGLSYILAYMASMYNWKARQEFHFGMKQKMSLYLLFQQKRYALEKKAKELHYRDILPLLRLVMTFDKNKHEKRAFGTGKLAKFYEIWVPLSVAYIAIILCTVFSLKDRGFDAVAILGSIDSYDIVSLMSPILTVITTALLMYSVHSIHCTLKKEPKREIEIMQVLKKI
jgi:hypothetical protein